MAKKVERNVTNINLSSISIDSSSDLMTRLNGVCDVSRDRTGRLVTELTNGGVTAVGINAYVKDLVVG